MLKAFYGLNQGDPITPSTNTTAKQFAKRIVEGRYTILHGTRSTLNSAIPLDRGGLETFVTDVIRRAVVELDNYVTMASSDDNTADFLAWVRWRAT
jgi:hypothetical protein